MNLKDVTGIYAFDCDLAITTTPPELGESLVIFPAGDDLEMRREIMARELGPIMGETVRSFGFDLAGTGCAWIEIDAQERELASWFETKRKEWGIVGEIV